VATQPGQGKNQSGSGRRHSQDRVRISQEVGVDTARTGKEPIRKREETQPGKGEPIRKREETQPGQGKSQSGSGRRAWDLIVTL
jgi:hypothetical protein